MDIDWLFICYIPVCSKDKYLLNKTFTKQVLFGNIKHIDTKR